MHLPSFPHRQGERARGWVEMEARNRKVLEGCMVDLPPEEKSDIVVFLSSTFTGTLINIGCTFHTKERIHAGELSKGVPGPL